MRALTVGDDEEPTGFDRGGPARKHPGWAQLELGSAKGAVATTPRSTGPRRPHSFRKTHSSGTGLTPWSTGC